MNETEKSIIVEFAGRLARLVSDFFGEGRFKEIVHENPMAVLFLSQYTTGFFGRKSVPISYPEKFDVEAFKKCVSGILNALVLSFGMDLTETNVENIYIDVERKYRPDVVHKIIMPLLENKFLIRRRVQYLSKEELEEQVFVKTKELRQLNEQLEEKVKLRTAELAKLLEQQHASAKLLIRRDLELTLANDKLRELDDRKSEFLSIVAHQLRTPLSGIKWTLAMIMHEELGAISVEQKDFLSKSYESNERMINLVDDMLHADRIDSGKYHMNLVATNIVNLIDTVLYDTLPSALKKHVTIVFNKSDGDVPLVMIDVEKMRAVFQNLLDNAVKYSKEKGTVTISIIRSTDLLTFSIQDTGIGVPADQQGLLYTRFFRSRNALKKETDGTGLGLYIVKSIIERHGGRIWFESKENEGTAFYFTIKI